MSRPTRINAGDGVTWTESSGDATAISYYFQDAQGVAVFSLAATIASGTATFALTGDDTTGEPPGIYTAWKATTEDGLRVSTDEGEFILAPNVDGSSAKTHAQITVALLEAHLAGRVVAGIESHTIDGQSIQKMSLADARALLNKYRTELKAEQDAFRGNAGKGAIIRHSFSE